MQVARESFFLQMLFFGHIRFEEGFLAEVKPEIYASAQSALRDCEVSLRLHSVLEVLQGNEKADFVSLSDVPSFLPDGPASQVLQTLRPSIVEGGTVVFRSHLRYIEPRSEGYVRLGLRFKQDTDRETSGLWRISIFGKEVTNV
jgi:S-adenosylmethionine-diacylglycerol 3-amino-3-carboxypropyl transferase